MCVCDAHAYPCTCVHGVCIYLRCACLCAHNDHMVHGHILECVVNPPTQLHCTLYRFFCCSLFTSYPPPPPPLPPPLPFSPTLLPFPSPLPTSPSLLPFPSLLPYPPPLPFSLPSSLPFSPTLLPFSPPLPSSPSLLPFPSPFPPPLPSSHYLLGDFPPPTFQRYWTYQVIRYPAWKAYKCSHPSVS